MNKKISKFLKYILSACVAVLLLYFSFREVEWKDFLEGLRSCRWEFILLSMAAGIAAFWFRGLRWRQLLLPIDPSTRRITTFNAVNIGYIANFVFPRIGEFVRCGVVTRRSAENKASYDKVLGTVVLERGWDMLTMLLLLVVLLGARWEKFGGFFMEQMWEPVSARLDFSIWWIVALLAASGLGCFWFIWRFRASGGLCSKIWGLFEGLLQGFSSCLRMAFLRFYSPDMGYVLAHGRSHNVGHTSPRRTQHDRRPLPVSGRQSRLACPCSRRLRSLPLRSIPCPAGHLRHPFRDRNNLRHPLPRIPSHHNGPLRRLLVWL